MSREIKFRGWDGVRMRQPQDLSQCSKYWTWLGMVDIELMQYTGLKDKNGVEIYEGDLIELHKNQNGYVQVIFKNAYVGGWVLAEKNTDHYVSLGARYPDDIEVIGNIHEASE